MSDPPLRLGSLFSGFGGLDIAIENTLGARVAWHCESNPHAARVLANRWPQTPNLGDITTVDWHQVPPVDVLAGGFPCQDLSTAGKRAGLTEGTRSGLWSQMATAIEVLKPHMVIAENVRGIASARADSGVEPCPSCLGEAGDTPSLRALGAVLGDLSDRGYDAEWVGLRASDAGAPHQRYRIIITAFRRSQASVADTGGVDEGVPLRARGVEDLRDRRDDRAGLHDQPLAYAVTGNTGTTERSESEVVADADRERRPGPGPETHERAVPDRGGPPDPARVTRPRVDLCKTWGPYAAAVDRWERILARPAPSPYEQRGDGGRRLNPRLVEWMMGIPAGHVTDIPGLSYRTRLRILGAGVVPQQAELALTWLLDRWTT